MSRERTIVEDFQENTRNCWPTNGDYDSVNAMLLYWADDDLKVEPEVLKLQKLLREDLRYNACLYQIPSKDPAINLQLELATLVKGTLVSTRSLTIVYYAGHADDVAEGGPAGYSAWRA